MKVVTGRDGSAWIFGLVGPDRGVPAVANFRGGVDRCVINAGELSVLLRGHRLYNEPCFDLVQTRKLFFVFGNKGFHCATGRQIKSRPIPGTQRRVDIFYVFA